MMGLIYNQENVYRLATSKLERDLDNTYGLDKTTVQVGTIRGLRWSASRLGSM